MSGKIDKLLVTSDGEQALKMTLALAALFWKLRVEWWYERVTLEGYTEFTLSGSEVHQLEGRTGGKLPFVLTGPEQVASLLHARLGAEESRPRCPHTGDGSSVKGWTVKYDGYGPIVVTAAWTYYGK
jgi:hypothetical protein